MHTFDVGADSPIGLIEADLMSDRRDSWAGATLWGRPYEPHAPPWVSSQGEFHPKIIDSRDVIERMVTGFVRDGRFLTRGEAMAELAECGREVLYA